MMMPQMGFRGMPPPQGGYPQQPPLGNFMLPLTCTEKPKGGASGFGGGAGPGGYGYGNPSSGVDKCKNPNCNRAEKGQRGRKWILRLLW